MSHVHIHNHRPSKTSDRNQYILVIAFWDIENSVPWTRTLRHRGVDTDWIASRPMNTQEREVHKKCRRLAMLNYHSWEGLIQDEWHETEDREWCEELHKLSKLDKLLDQVLAITVEKPVTQSALFEQQTNSPY